MEGIKTSGFDQNHYMYKILKQQKVTVVFVFIFVFFSTHQYIVQSLLGPAHGFMNLYILITNFFLFLFASKTQTWHLIEFATQQQHLFTGVFTRASIFFSWCTKFRVIPGRLRMPIEVFSNTSSPAMLATFSLVTARWMVYITEFVKLNSLSFWYHNSNHTDITSL